MEAEGAAASLEVSMQGSGAHPAAEQSADTSATQSSMSQPSAAMSQGLEYATTQYSAVPGSGLATSVAAQAEHEAVPAAASSLCSQTLQAQAVATRSMQRRLQPALGLSTSYCVALSQR